MKRYTIVSRTEFASSVARATLRLEAVTAHAQTAQPSFPRVTYSDPMSSQDGSLDGHVTITSTVS